MKLINYVFSFKFCKRLGLIYSFITVSHKFTLENSMKGIKQYLITNTALLNTSTFTFTANHHYHHQFLTPAIWRRWVRTNCLQCPRSFVKSIAPLRTDTALLNVSPVDSMSSFILSSHHNLGLTLFLFLSNLACSALCGIRSIVILSHMSKPSETLILCCNHSRVSC